MLGPCSSCHEEKYRGIYDGVGNYYIKCRKCGENVYHWKCQNCGKGYWVSEVVGKFKINLDRIFDYIINWTGALIIFLGFLLIVLARALVSGPSEGAWIKLAALFVGVIFIISGNYIVNKK